MEEERVTNSRGDSNETRQSFNYSRVICSRRDRHTRRNADVVADIDDGNVYRDNAEVDDGDRLTDGAEYIDDGREYIDDSIPIAGNRQSRRAHHNRGTGARVTTFFLALALAAEIGVGSYLATGAIKENNRTNSLVAAAISKDDKSLCELPKTVVSERSYDIKYASGKKLVNSLRSHGIKYCKVLDEYYTEDGADIVLVTFNVFVEKEIDATKNNVGDDAVYTVPSGYAFKNGKAVRQSIETCSLIFPLMDQANYSLTEYAHLFDGRIVSYEMVDMKTIHTRPYADIINSDLVVDVNDSFAMDEKAQHDAYGYPATLRLVKRN